MMGLLDSYSKFLCSNPAVSPQSVYAPTGSRSSRLEKMGHLEVDTDSGLYGWAYDQRVHVAVEYIPRLRSSYMGTPLRPKYLL